MESKTIKCRDCGRILGEALEDFQYLRLGENANLFLPTRFSCRCGKPFVWQPKLPPDEQTETQLAIEKEWRNTLGRKPRVADTLEG